MNYAAIRHRCAFTDCYAVSADEIEVRLTTGKDVESAVLVHDDPYISHGGPWKGKRTEMRPLAEFEYTRIWYARIKPPFKREQYYFEISGEGETVVLAEDRIYKPDEWEREGRMKQWFRFPWLNSADVFEIPAWAEKTVWYQIMPDRFRRGDPSRPHSKRLRAWKDIRHIVHNDFYGGDLCGITEKLPYLKELGVTGIYLTPIFRSNTHHKYNTADYTEIDPDLGTEEDLIALVERAHSLGIRVMLDAVFNHSGTDFFAWRDVVEKGKKSKYFDWYFINGEKDFWKEGAGTHDGRYYSFAFAAYMPKLNTNNPEVIAYFTNICKNWLEKWHIDGIRFDVGNEVSHAFLARLRAALKTISPDVFLLGEIWHDSLPWLVGGEYDSVMNYPFLQSINDFWLDRTLTSRDLGYALGRIYTMYYAQVGRALFNLIDSHDVMRAYTRCGDIDIFFQQLALLMTMPGSPCIYYGTEVALAGGYDPDNRRPMPWNDIESGKCDDIIAQVKALIAVRKNFFCGEGVPAFSYDERFPRLIRYAWKTQAGTLEVLLNAGTAPVPVPERTPLFARKCARGLLEPNGILILS